ncbi:RICIN domain-containing protein [Actinoplanes aureus]|jgi:hypothetical protein|uniref:RICIN domain-containing protein n=1 Tax=Actinoplanes aureus TaxID=2792083 RepID=A0A931C849_9ACTN|nr:RICIN domain-containing protein [Actinoplanes aureus]MBG0563944.1 RICIN domain-containing protein [Actinoplanes aureus]
MTLATAIVVHQSPASAATTLGPFRIVGEDSGKCMDNPNSASGNGVGQIIYTCNRNFPINQQWYFDETDSGYYWIRNRASNKCLAVSGAAVTINVAIVQYTCNNGNNQEWLPKFWGTNPDGRDYYYLVSRGGVTRDQFSIHVKNGSNSNSAALIQYYQVGGSNSRWTWYKP